MKRYLVLLIVFVLLISGCTKAPKPPKTEEAPPPTADPITPQVAEFAPQNYIFHYNDKTYSDFYCQYGYHYYFDGISLIPTGDTVQVDEWNTCGTGLPENYDPFAFNGTVFTIADDIYGGEFVFVYNKTRNVYYPFRCHITVPSNSGYTVKSYIDKRYGEGSFDSITEVRLALSSYTNEWFEIPEEIETELLKTVKNQLISGASCDCNHYTLTDKHCTLRLVLSKTRFEHTLTLCPTTLAVNGRKIPKTLCDDIMSCTDMKYHKETQFSQNKID